MTELVTVLMPAYNHAEFVEKAVRSVWSQTYRPIELVVIDDCSTDDTAQRLAALAAESPIPMCFRRNDANHGVCYTLNRCLDEAHGEWVGFLASDDYYAPEKTAIQVSRAVSLGSAYGCIHSDGYLVDRDERIQGTIFEASVLPPLRGEAFRPMALGTAKLVPVTVLVRTHLARSVGAFDEALRAEDFDFHLRLTQATKYDYVDEPLTYSRVLEGSLGRSPDRYVRDMFRALAKHHLALGDDYHTAVRRRALHFANLSLANGSLASAAYCLRRGMRSAGAKEKVDLVLNVAAVAGVLAARRLIAGSVPGRFRRAASRSFQSWLYS